jgi:phosphoenolpyruvate carboxykinase (GTP)
MTKEPSGKPGTSNKAVLAWVDEMAKHCKPDRVYWCDGSKAERKALTAEAVERGILLKLNQKKLPGCYYHRSNPNDVARVEQSTFICTESQEEAGPTNNWMAPKEMYQKLRAYAEGSMRGRTMYVVPYLMGPPGSPLAKVGLELTDSIYVALSMGTMTRMGEVALEELGNSDDFNRGLHCMLDVNPERRYIAHFPKDNAIISVGSNYGGNVLLGKKCLALRIGSYLGRQEGWFAEHMLILGVESPAGEKTYVTAAFPSSKSNPAAVQMISRDTIFTNVALTPDLDVWWEGKDGPPPKECFDWKGNKWTPDSEEKAAHPNSRFTAPMTNNPLLAPEVNDSAGVPIRAIIFGGRRSNTTPLIYQAFNWVHGVYIGATMGSEMTAAAVGGAGQVRRDPMAMLPFCGYHMGDYFRHWINMHRTIKHPPRIFHVNWFRKNGQGEFLWPGFGENMRVLKWIIDRCHARTDAEETALGWVPGPNSLDLNGLTDFSPERLERAQAIYEEEWRREILMQDELFMKLHARLPKELIFQRELLLARL